MFFILLSGIAFETNFRGKFTQAPWVSVSLEFLWITKDRVEQLNALRVQTTDLSIQKDTEKSSSYTEYQNNLCKDHK